MIRTPPQHNTKHPPGQVVAATAAPINQEKTLAKEIEAYIEIQHSSEYQKGFHAGYKLGYLDGFKKGKEYSYPLDLGSEAAR